MSLKTPLYGVYRFENITPMIVDDGLHIRKLIKDVLFCFGCTRVLEACDGSDAIGQLKQGQVDMIFCNWVMAPMDGIEFLRYMRDPQNSPDPYAPIVIVSAHSTIEYIKKARDAGANAFLTKPFTPGSLAKIITSMVENPRPFIKTKTYFGPDRRTKNFPHQNEERRAAS